MVAEPPVANTNALLGPLVGLLRCLNCAEALAVHLAAAAGYPELGPDGVLACSSCGERYPLIAGTPRMLERGARQQLPALYPAAAEAALAAARGAGGPAMDAVKSRTAESFGYEWERFGAWRPEWERNFVGYLAPHAPGWLRGRRVLDVGTGSGRHAFEAARLGAEVVAVDIGPAIDVARANLPASVLTVQADAERLPLAAGIADFVMSIGVLHHLADPPSALRKLVPFARTGGRVHVYLYWMPDLRSHRVVLRAVRGVRRVTARLDHSLLQAICYPLAALLHLAVVVPTRALRHRQRGHRLVERLPLQTYADYPFGVLVNDQFDRFSAPLEHRYTRLEVAEMMADAGLDDVVVLPNAGWVADGRRPG